MEQWGNKGEGYFGAVGRQMRVSKWHGCYDDQWSGLIVPEAYLEGI